jgi:hypothetical protein
LIDVTEKKVSDYYNTVVNESEKFFEQNDNLMNLYKNETDDIKKREYRKHLAIKNCKNKYFPLLMKKLEEKKIDYKDFVRSNISM